MKEKIEYLGLEFDVEYEIATITEDVIEWGESVHQEFTYVDISSVNGVPAVHLDEDFVEKVAAILQNVF